MEIRIRLDERRAATRPRVSLRVRDLASPKADCFATNSLLLGPLGLLLRCSSRLYSQGCARTGIPSPSFSGWVRPLQTFKWAFRCLALVGVPTRTASNLWRLEKQRPKCPFAHALADLGPREINSKY